MEIGGGPASRSGKIFSPMSKSLAGTLLELFRSRVVVAIRVHRLIRGGELGDDGHDPDEGKHASATRNVRALGRNAGKAGAVIGTKKNNGEAMIVDDCVARRTRRSSPRGKSARRPEARRRGSR